MAVDYAPVKYVKKPGGARPGMVVYTTYETAYVAPRWGAGPAAAGKIEIPLIRGSPAGHSPSPICGPGHPERASTLEHKF